MNNKNYLLIPVSIIIAGIIIGGAIIYSDFSLDKKVVEEKNKLSFSLKGKSFLGSEKAPVTIVEFSDFQCPFCRNFWKDTFPQIKKEYIDTGKVKFFYLHFPLKQIHPSATSAAEATYCAREQGKFWEMHDIIFEEQEKRGSNFGTVQFTNDDLKEWAVKIGLDSSKFNQCLDYGKYTKEVEKDFSDGLNSGVDGTPAFFINNQLLVGSQPFDNFKAAIEKELKNK